MKTEYEDGSCVGVNGNFGFWEWVAVLRFWPSFRWFWLSPTCPLGCAEGQTERAEGDLCNGALYLGESD